MGGGRNKRAWFQATRREDFSRIFRFDACVPRSACAHACLGRLRCCSVGMCAPSAKVLPTTATRAAHTAPPRTTSIVAGAACTAIAPSSSKVPPYLPLPALPNCRRCRQYKPCSLAEQPLHLTSTASLRWYSRGEALAFFFWDSLHPTSPHPTPHCLTTPSPTPPLTN